MQAQSKHYVYRTETGSVEFWADRGRVYVMDLNKAGDSQADVHEQIKSMAPGEFMERAIAVRVSADERFPDEIARARQLLNRATEVCKIAWHFGDPTSQKVLDHLSKHRSKSRILMPGDAMPDIGGIKLKPALVKDPREALLTGKGVEAVPDFSLPQGQRLSPSHMSQLRRRRR